MNTSKTCLLFIFLLSSQLVFAQQDFTLSGYVKDAGNGETYSPPIIYNKDNPVQGTTTNVYGFYSLTLPEGEYTFLFSYLGYSTKEVRVDLKEDTRLNIDLIEGVE